MFPQECTETFLEGHRRAFEYFGGVPRRISYDNSAIAVIEIFKGRERKLTKEFLRLQRHYLFQEHFCLVRRPTRRVTSSDSWASLAPASGASPAGRLAGTLNRQLREGCQPTSEADARQAGPQGRTPVEDQAGLLPLPKQPFEARYVADATADSQSLVRFDTNDYSVPVKYAHRKLMVVATVEEVRLVYEDRLVARHPRCWQRERTRFEPIHYLALWNASRAVSITPGPWSTGSCLSAWTPQTPARSG